MNNTAHYVHNLDPFLVRFTENFGIRYYGLAYLLGFFLGIGALYLYDRHKRSLIRAPIIPDYLWYLLLGVLLGGRLGYFLLYTPEVLFQRPLEILKVWDGGMSAHGGFIGVGLAALIFSWHRKIPISHVLDLTSTISAFGFFFGRIANFINGELYGKVTDVAWGVIFPQSAPGTPIALIQPRHPSQLYEALLEGLLLIIYSQLRVWKSDVLKRRPGQLAGEYLLLYSAARAFCEIFREPDLGDPLTFGLSRGTLYSFLLIATGLYLVLRKTKPLPPIIDLPPPETKK